MSLSKNKIKYIRSLELKKYRKADRVFLAEGDKLVEELLDKLPCRLLAATPEWLSRHCVEADEVYDASLEELARASMLKTPQQVLAVFAQPEYAMDATLPAKELCLALDDVQDPGNLGTIIRLADWFGIEHIYCSENTVDVYNPKVVQATMGAIGRVQLHYTSLSQLIGGLPSGTPVYGTFLDGKDMYEGELSDNGLIVMGNEGKGVSPEVEEKVTHKLFIPNYPLGRPTSESLNVAIATAVVCAEFRRRSRN